MRGLYGRPMGVSTMRGLKSALYNSIKGQVFIVFAATFLSVSALMLLNIWSLSTVKARLLLGERYYQLLNDTLELRRFEKNYLFYNDPASLEEGTAYLRRIRNLASELSSDIAPVMGRETFDAFVRALNDYDRSLKAYQADSTADKREAIRQAGKIMVDLAEKFLDIKKERIRKAIVQTSIVPFAFLFIFMLFMLLVIRLISQGLLRPLEVLQATIERVAKGDYSPTSYEGIHNDEIAGLIGAFNRMAQEIEANQEDLLQARKIAALGTFTAGIAHELNNPINNIGLTVETCMEEYGATMEPDAKELMRDILMQAERAGDIVRNLLDFSRTERPKFSSLAVKEIVASTVALVKNQIMLAGIKLELEIPEAIPRVRGHIRKLQQVFMNFLLNAIQAMPDGGAISIAARAESENMVRIDVRDTGMGIAQEVLEHIFEPFFTTKSVGRGTGLGLAVSYAIVKGHGGRIQVQSVVGKGTVFSVFLPIADPEDLSTVGGDGETRDDSGANSNN